MNTELFITSLKERGIEVYAESGKLKVSISKSLRTTIAENKEELLQWLMLNEDTRENRPLGKRAENSLIPLSYSQQAMWLVEQVNVESLQYNMPMKVKLKGALNVDALSWALNELVRYQPALRTGVEVVSGQPTQVVRTFSFEPLSVVDLSDLNGHALEVRVNEESERELHSPFDLAKDTLIRNRLIKTGEDEFILLHTLHHIASDGWSISVLTRQLSELYRNHLNGNKSSLPPLVLDYADYACWQRQFLQGSLLKPLEEFWGNHLLGAPASHSLPLDSPRGTAQSYEGSIFESEIESSTLEAFKAECQRNNATLFIGLHAILSMMIASLGQDDDVVIGTPVANREDMRLHDIVGLFINTLPLRCQLSEQDSFTDLLLQCRTTLLTAFEHQQLPFDLLLESLNIARPQNHSPLFQVMLVLQNNVDPVLDLPEVEVKADRNSAISSKYDFTLYAKELDGELKLFWEYNTSLFSQQTIERFSQLFQQLVEEAIRFPNVAYSQLNLVTPRLDATSAHEQVLLQRPKGEPNNLMHMLEAQVACTPDNTAVILDDERLSYRELHNLVKGNAIQLASQGVQAGKRVGIHTPRGLEMIVAILATLRLGASYVPLDPTYPVDRLNYMIADAEVEVIAIAIGQSIDVNNTVAAWEVSLSPEMRSNVISNSDDELLLSSASNSRISYVIYTSGSTGVPKGVLGTELSVINRLTWMWEQFPFQDDEVCCQKTSLNFVDHVWELFGPLLKGVPLVLMSQEDMKNPAALAQKLSSNNVTRLVLVPTLLKGLLSLPQEELLPLKGIRYWTSSGETLSANVVKEFYDVFQDSCLLNIYGSSEVGADITYYDTRNLLPGMASVPIGSTISNIDLYIVNRWGQILPDGFEGELYVGGASLAAGYTDSTLTEERFVHLKNVSPTLFKTGDLVRKNTDGTLEYLGRNDDQIKVRGHRVELAEVTALLREHVGTQDIVVIDSEHLGQTHLVAYIVNNKQLENTEQIYQLLSRELPEYMIPSAINVIKELPLTLNGKLNKKALPEPKWISSEYYVAPRTELEKQLCKIWEETLEVEQVGIFDNYYRIGGNSIHAVKLVTAINQQLGLGIQIRDIFEQKSVEGLARSHKAKSQEFSESLDSAKNKQQTSRYQEVEL